MILFYGFALSLSRFIELRFSTLCHVPKMYLVEKQRWSNCLLFVFASLLNLRGGLVSSMVRAYRHTGLIFLIYHAVHLSPVFSMIPFLCFGVVAVM